MDELTAVKLAIRMEEKAAMFYGEAARQTSDPQAKKILGKFSEDEEKHGQFLQTLVDNYYIKNGRFDPPDLTATEYPVNKDGPIYGKSMKELSSHPEPVAAAVEKFALAEGEAIALYRKLSAESQDKALSEFFAKLADWEQRHLDLLRKQGEAFRAQRT